MTMAQYAFLRAAHQVANLEEKAILSDLVQRAETREASALLMLNRFALRLIRKRR